MPEILRPKQVLREIGKEIPQVWQQVKSFRAGKGKDLPDWPDWCYIPIAAGMAIATQGDDNRVYQAGFNPITNPAVITAAAAWRVSQGVYRFDADLYNALVEQPLDGNIPCAALKRLPEWCVYIETIGMKFEGDPVTGFWAHLEKDMNDGREELRFVIMFESGQNLPFPLHIGDWTIEEGVERMKVEAETQAARQGVSFNIPKGANFSMLAQYVTPIIQLVLYLCAENIDIPRTPKHPNTRVRMSGQVDVPREPRFWDIGERIGTTIRKYRNEEAQATLSEQEKTPDTQASTRPHIRRAHWHHFWTGPRDGERKLILRWLPPIPVGIDGDEENPAVIHKVE